MDREKMKSVLESVLFVWGEPLEAGLAAEVLQTGREEALSLLEELCEDYENRKGGIRIQSMENAFQFYTPGENHEFLQRLTGTDKEKKLSRSAMETLAIIAYKQPVTRSEIEEIRGVKCARMIEGLVQKGRVEEQGRSLSIGRPVVFGTTPLVLRYFGIQALEQLPRMEPEQEEKENQGE